MTDGGADAPGPTTTGPAARQRGPNWLALGFAALAVVLAIAAVVVALQERGQGQRPLPVATPGQNEAINVLEALRAQGLTAEFGKRGVPRGELSVPGQEVVVDGIPAYVFLYPDAAQAESEAAAADPAKALPRPAAGVGATPVAAAGSPFLTHHSNVIVVVPGGGDDLHEKVRRAVEGLP